MKYLKYINMAKADCTVSSHVLSSKKDKKFTGHSRDSMPKETSHESPEQRLSMNIYYMSMPKID